MKISKVLGDTPKSWDEIRNSSLIGSATQAERAGIVIGAAMGWNMCSEYANVLIQELEGQVDNATKVSDQWEKDWNEMCDNYDKEHALALQLQSLIKNLEDELNDRPMKNEWNFVGHLANGTPLQIDRRVHIDVMFRNGRISTDKLAGTACWAKDLCEPSDNDVIAWRESK